MKRPIITHRSNRFRFRRYPAYSIDEKKSRDSGTTVIAAIREYLSDILGAFMPGVYFSLNLLISIALLLPMITGQPKNVKSFIDNLSQSVVLKTTMPFMVFAFCLFSYIIGSVFYRKDTKEPDTASAIETYRKSSELEKKGLAFDVKDAGGKPFKLLTWLYMRMNFRVDFPYSHLKRYLNTRNYTHLAEHIPWEGNESKKRVRQRSKMFINILKARLHHYAPMEMPEIEKNEAHVRLMNSLWYAAKAIRNIACVVLGGIFVCYVLLGVLSEKICWQPLTDLFEFISQQKESAVWKEFVVWLVLFSVIQLLVSWYIRYSITRYFHYMRVREIMFILEIADTINRNSDIDMFAGLEPEKKELETLPNAQWDSKCPLVNHAFMHYCERS